MLKFLRRLSRQKHLPIMDDQTALALMKDPTYQWQTARSATPAALAQLLRSDELSGGNMLAFRSTAKDWHQRDQAISDERRKLGLFVVHPYSDQLSEWSTKYHNSGASERMRRFGPKEQHFTPNQ